LQSLSGRFKSGNRKLIRKPYLIFLGDVTSRISAKTAFGLKDWCGSDVVGQFSLPECTIDLGIPSLDPQQAAAQGAGSLVIGVAPIGGRIPVAWRPALIAAATAGLDIVSGMHERLADVPELAAAAAGSGAHLHDVRHPGLVFDAGTGRKRSGLRLLTVGTDCALGKKYAALAIARDLKALGGKATFRATGQTGIMIAGSGVPIDAVVADFIAGAAEWLSPDNERDHWDIIEGQGALFHPAYSGVTLGLLHGSQPDALVLCHEPGRENIDGFPGFPISAIETVIEQYLTLARLTNPAVEMLAVSLNTSRLSDDSRQWALADLRRRTGLLVFDPVRDGTFALAEVLKAKADAIEGLARVVAAAEDVQS
jgi:uncharacterized NAD-dependent epimerase/dehydratase family protein